MEQTIGKKLKSYFVILLFTINSFDALINFYFFFTLLNTIIVPEKRVENKIKLMFLNLRKTK
jgi:hypothetical protein